MEKKTKKYNPPELQNSNFELENFPADQYHQHDGIDQKKIIPARDLSGFPIYTAVPIHKAEEGTFVTATFGGSVYVYLMLNKVWNLVGQSPSSFSNTVALNFGAIAPHSSADLTMTLTGAVLGDPVVLGVADGVISGGTNCANIAFFAWVSAADTVKIRCVNNDAALTANPANGNFTSKIMKL